MRDPLTPDPLTTPASSPGRRRVRRAGTRTLAAGLVLAVVSVVLTASTSYPTGLGVMLGLVLMYVAALYALATGVLRMRIGTDGAGDHSPAGSSWVCLLLDHRFLPVPPRDDAPGHWRCRRCGKRRYTRPVSADETLSATRVDQQWIRRGDAPDDRR